MSAVYAASRAAVSRRRLQTVIVGIVVLLSAATAVLAIGLLVVSHAPFDTAFAAARGADVTATVRAGTSAGALATTTSRPGVTAAAGPFDQTSARVNLVGGVGSDAATIVGRSAQAGTVDRLSLDAGHWLTGPGQIVLSREYAGPLADRIGSEVSVGVPGSPRLRLVGIAVSVTGTADAWVWPTQNNVLHAAGAPTAEQMLYRFAGHGSTSALATSLRTATAGLPAGTVTGTSTYLSARLQANRNISAFVPFIVAFAVLGLVLSVLICANVVNGAVVSGYRTIGILKTLGYTPGQVVAVYVAQVLVPAIVGAVLGVGLGIALAAPLLKQTDQAYNLPASTGGIPLWVTALVLVGAPVLVILSALGPALRAGRLAPNQAISIGRAPRAGRGFRLRRRLTATGMPRSVALGLGMPLARPARTAGTMVAIMLGAVTLVFAIGLTSSLGRIHDAFSRISAVPVDVPVFDGSVIVKGGPGPAPVNAPPLPATGDPAALMKTIRTQPGTAHVASMVQAGVHVAGFNPAVNVEAYTGDASWAGFAMIEGHWYAGPNQVVASSYLLRQSGHRVGDRITIVGDGGRRVVTIVGDFLDGSDRYDLVADSSAMAGVARSTDPGDVEIGLTPGTNPSTYTRALQSRFGVASGVFVDDRTQGSNERTFVILDTLIGTLTLLL
ncbi:MAG TPA: FtsX-like permease family protein, partial [Micromonosporaceae bacterium]